MCDWRQGLHDPFLKTFGWSCLECYYYDLLRIWRVDDEPPRHNVWEREHQIQRLAARVLEILTGWVFPDWLSRDIGLCAASYRTEQGVCIQAGMRVVRFGWEPLSEIHNRWLLACVLACVRACFLACLLAAGYCDPTPLEQSYPTWKQMQDWEVEHRGNVSRLVHTLSWFVKHHSFCACWHLRILTRCGKTANFCFHKFVFPEMTYICVWSCIPGSHILATKINWYKLELGSDFVAHGS